MRINDYYMGIDAGSTMCKAVLMNGNEILDAVIQKSGWNVSRTALALKDMILDSHSLDMEQIKVIATGYGREQIPFADKMLTEISAHAIGGIYLSPSIQGIIDIGGQDSKIIRIADKKAAAFLMNDKCAAGTGRFLEMTCDKLELTLDQIDDFIQSEDYVTINSMCAVFAESEIIGQLASGCSREKILNGSIRSIAAKIGGMIRKIDALPQDVFLMTGGLSRSSAVVDTIIKMTGYSVITNDMSVYAGAIGAALFGAKS